MNFATMHRESSSSTLATVALLTAAIGFGGGWLAHRNAAGRMLLPYRGPVKAVATAGATYANDLAVAEAECPGASRAIVANSPTHYRIERKVLKCLMSSAKMSTLRAAPRYTPVWFKQNPRGFRVFEIKPGSLAARLGLQNGDIIRTVDARVVNTEEDLVEAYKRLGSGNYASVGLERKGEYSVHIYYLGPSR